MANDAGFYLHVDGYEGFDKSVDFDKKEIRKAMRSIGRLIERRAKRDLSSGGGGARYPVVRTGALRDGIGIKVSRSGFLVRVRPEKTSAMGRWYYPAYLHYGVKRRTGAGMRVEPRDNYMVDALQAEAGDVESILRVALGSALRIK
jgi:hypothetical protein